MRLAELGRFQRFAALGSTFLVLALLLLLIAELSVRVRSYLQTGFWWGVEDTYTIDELTGLRVPRPGLVTSRITINSHGFRGPDVSLEKDPDTVRFAFLGGSTTYCAEVSSNSMTWPHLVIEKMRDEFPEISFDYINAAVPGFGVEHSQQTLELRVNPFKPDVIIVYHATNDLSYNSFQIAMQAGVADKRSDESQFWLSKYSLLSHLIELNLKVLFLQLKAQTQEPDSDKLEVDTDQLSEPFEGDLRELVRIAQKQSEIVALATFSIQYRREQSMTEQTQAANMSLYYMPYMTISGLLDSFDAYNATIRDVARSENAILIEGEHDIPGDSDHFNDSVHFKDKGSVAMAERVTKSLLESSEMRMLIETRAGGTN